ncbi:MAG: site-specific DNA-methyltransferase [Rhodomicrobium sp.]
MNRWRHMREVLAAAENTYTELKNLCVWTKTNAGMGSLYRSGYEFVFAFKNGEAPHINNVELGRFGRNRSNVWHYAGVTAFIKDRKAELGMHPTVKPLALVADAIMDCSNRGTLVLDAFAGSGTTLMAAERTGRKGYGIEIEPHHADTILRRFDCLYGLKAVHTQSNKSLEAIESERLGKAGHGQGSKERHGRRKGDNSSGRPKYGAKNRPR